MNILILNVHSALNLGDDGIMQETLRRLQADYPEARVTVAANDPDSWDRYEDVCVVGSMLTWVIDREHDEWAWRKSHMLTQVALLLAAAAAFRIFSARLLFGGPMKRDLLKAYYQANLVLSCGGGNFYANEPLSPAFVWSLLTLGFAHILDKKVVMLPQSIGPIEGQLQRLLARLTFDRVSRIMVRERRSQALLKELGVQKPVAVVPDLAFGVPSEPGDCPLSLEEELGTPRVGVTVIDRSAQDRRFNRQRDYEDILTSVLVDLALHQGAHIYFFVQCFGPTRDHDDRLSTKRVYERVLRQTGQAHLLDSFRTATDIKHTYGHMDCVIGSRMHSGVFALATGVPVVLIAYQPKAYGVMEMFELDRYCCSIETIQLNELSALVNEALVKRQQISLRIAQHLKEVRHSLRHWTEHIRE